MEERYGKWARVVAAIEKCFEEGYVLKNDEDAAAVQSVVPVVPPL